MQLQINLLHVCGQILTLLYCSYVDLCLLCVILGLTIAMDTLKPTSSLLQW